jgi:hypothetical protein
VVNLDPVGEGDVQQRTSQTDSLDRFIRVYFDRHIGWRELDRATSHHCSPSVVL